MYVKINISECRKADVIVTTGSGAASGVIKNGIGSSVSHAMLYVGDRYVLEAIATGVKKRLWERATRDDGEVTLAIALRRKNMNDAARQAVVDAALKYIDLPYDTIGAIGSGAFGDRRGGIIANAGCAIMPSGCVVSSVAVAENARDENADNAFFCSELVARAFTAGGYPIVDGKATWQTPGAIRLSPYLNYVGHLIDTPIPETAPKKMIGYRHD